MKRLICIGVFAVVLFIGLSGGTDTLASPTLKSSTFYGGSGDQLGTGISIHDGAIYLAASIREDISQGSHISYILKYTLPPGGTPAWSRSFDYGTHFYGLSITDEGIYCAGWSWGLSNDPVGGKEVKSFLGKFNLDGSSGPGIGDCLWYRTPNFFGYSGHEQFCGATTLVQGAVPYTYAIGFGEPGSPRSGFFIAKYDVSGNLINWATEPFPMNTYNYSSGNAATAYNDAIFSVGSSSWLAPGAGWPLKPTLWKHDANLNLLKRNEYTAFLGELRGVTAFAGAIYAVGQANTPAGPDFLIMKYDEAGEVIWHRISGGTGEDVLTGIVGICAKLYAVGYTRSEGAGNADLVVLEIDPATGDILDKVLYGGTQDDLAKGCATDGSDLFIVGYSRSFAENGNALGEYEVVLLQYGVGLKVDIDIKPGEEPNSINLGSNGNVPVAIFSTADFDATQIDPATVTLSGASVRLKGKGDLYMTSVKDINGDDLPDLLVHVDTTAMQLSEGDIEAVLEGKTNERSVHPGYGHRKDRALRPRGTILRRKTTKA